MPQSTNQFVVLAKKIAAPAAIAGAFVLGSGRTTGIEERESYSQDQIASWLSRLAPRSMGNAVWLR
jgi:hypothetical protein